MLQQTRVSTVIPYFKRWISKWPTIQDLADASHDDVLSVWKGLGYYSRATRLQQGAQAMIAANPDGCPIPSSAEELQNFPGIGRYTAGAVSSIAFGKAEPVLDGNVARVLSRQLGLYVDVKEKKNSDVLWDVADHLVKSVASFPEIERSKIPVSHCNTGIGTSTDHIKGQWNQAIMELGSTICTPKPKCDECPISRTCRVYAEGERLAARVPPHMDIQDIEDSCNLCLQLNTEDLVVAPEEKDDGDDEKAAPEKPSKRRKVEVPATKRISHYFTITRAKANPTDEALQGEHVGTGEETMSRKKTAVPAGQTARAKSVAAYCSLFPKRIPKKNVAEEDAAVCIIQAQTPDGNSTWLIEQRPAKGLLASLWQFPQSTLQEETQDTASRAFAARNFVMDLEAGIVDLSQTTHVGELGSLLHVFSHLKLTMHVHLFRVKIEEAPDSIVSGSLARKWVSTDDMDKETLSTGMRRCWELVQNAN